MFKTCFILKDLATKSFLNFEKCGIKDCERPENRVTSGMKEKITVIELKTRNLSLRIKCSFSKINSALFCPALVYSTFIKLSSHQ